jgi:tetratricopeptide (TPR) repeat protein
MALLAGASGAGGVRITKCDLLAGHPADPDRVAPGLERKDMNLPAAEAECRKQLAETPDHARTAYQLGRSIYYQGRHAEAIPYLERAANAGYPQATFVLGYVLSDGPEDKRDLCRAGSLWLRSAGLEHPWSGYHLVEKSLDGAFRNCSYSVNGLDRYMRLAAENITVSASAGRVEKLRERFEQAKASPAQASEVTLCDRLAAHPDDPRKLTPGVSETAMDKPAAVSACRAAVKADPDNPRLNYQLARALGYSGLGAQAYPYRDKAVAGEYPQALFVVGYITMLGLNEQPKDVCRGADLIRRSAKADRFAGQVGFVYWAIDGRFKGCKVPVDKAEMLRFLDRAKQHAGSDFYKATLVESLRQRLDALKL